MGISESDASQLIFADSAEEAFPHLVKGLENLEAESSPQPKPCRAMPKSPPLLKLGVYYQWSPCGAYERNKNSCVMLRLSPRSTTGIFLNTSAERSAVTEQLRVTLDL